MSLDPFFLRFPGVSGVLAQLAKRAADGELPTEPLARAGYEVVAADDLSCLTIALFNAPGIAKLDRRRGRPGYVAGERRSAVTDYLIRIPRPLNHHLYRAMARRDPGWPGWIRDRGLLIYLPGTVAFIVVQACRKALAFHLARKERVA